MLQFRFTTLLKELSEATLKRPLADCRQRSWLLSRQRRFCAASVDARAVCTHLKALHAAAHRPALRTAPCFLSTRSFCTKTEGVVEQEEQLKKDEGVNLATGEK